MKFSPRFFSVAAVVLLTLIVYSCEKADTLIERELLFTMPIGRMEDQLFVQQFEGVNTLSKTRILMKDGFFFISNGEASKVMEFTSFGDLISLFYNSEKNPAPVTLGESGKDSSDITRVAFQYPLKDPGEVVKMSNGSLLIDDRITEQRWEYDEERDVRLDRIILNFNDDGELISYIGQEGAGGTPFPYIHALYTNTKDDIIVVTRNPSGWEIFWYNNQSEPIYRIEFNNESIPVKDDSSPMFIENIRPDVKDRILYLKIDYYTQSESKKIKFNKSIMLGYDLNDKKYTLNMVLPRNIVKSEQPVIFEQKEREYLYEFAGVARGPSFFMISPYKNSVYRLTVVDEAGAVKGRGLIEFSDDDIFFRNYYVSPEGIFSAIVCGEYKADIVWWRSDRFIEEPNSEYRNFITNERD